MLSVLACQAGLVGCFASCLLAGVEAPAVKAERKKGEVRKKNHLSVDVEGVAFQVCIFTWISCTGPFKLLYHLKALVGAPQI